MKKIQIQTEIYRYWTSPSPIVFDPSGMNFAFVGIDPGKNFGVALLIGETLTALGGRLNDKYDPISGISAVETIQNILDEFLPVGIRVRTGIVEGAAYNARYGQDFLGQVRFGFLYGLYLRGFKTKYIPPDSARKIVFGSAKLSADGIWIRMNPNAADAVGVLLAGVYQFKESRGE